MVHTCKTAPSQSTTIHPSESAASTFNHHMHSLASVALVEWLPACLQKVRKIELSSTEEYNHNKVLPDLKEAPWYQNNVERNYNHN